MARDGYQSYLEAAFAQYGLTQASVTYWFPDEVFLEDGSVKVLKRHMEEFLAALVV